MNWKKIVKTALLPHPAFAGLFCPAALGLLLYSAFACEPEDAVSIIAYALSFYALVLVSLRVPDMLRFACRFRQENRFAVRYASDVRFRMSISLCGALAFNAAYAVFQLCLGLIHRSVWFYSMAGYYLLLGGMRLMLARHTRSCAPGERREAEWRKYRLCGVMLLVMTLTLAVFVIYFVWKIRVFRHYEITTIAMATYTFASLTLAAVNAVKYRNSESPAYSAAKTISLASALVSLLTLENAMLTAFGQDSGEAFRRIMLGATGAAVILAIWGIAVGMIVRAARNIRRIHNS